MSLGYFLFFKLSIFFMCNYKQKLFDNNLTLCFSFNLITSSGIVNLISVISYILWPFFYAASLETSYRYGESFEVMQHALLVLFFFNCTCILSLWHRYRRLEFGMKQWRGRNEVQVVEAERWGYMAGIRTWCSDWLGLRAVEVQESGWRKRATGGVMVLFHDYSGFRVMEVYAS